MSEPSHGLQNDAFNQQSVNTVNTPVQNATQDYVIEYVNGKFDPIPNVNINIENSGVCITTVSGTNNTVVDIGLCSTLGDLTDVDLPTPVPTGSYLKYNGTSWSTGSGVSKFSITDLNDFVTSSTTTGLTNGAFLKVNSTGTSIIQNTDAVSEIQSSNSDGLLISNPDPNDPTRYAISLDVNNLQTVNAQSSTDFIPIEVNNNTRKIQLSNIDLSNLSNANSNFISTSSISTSVVGGASTTLTGVSLGNDYTITLDMSDILTSVGGVLPISQGGTSANNQSDARINLGVSYNSDVISYKSGEFRDILTGDDLKFVSGGTSSVTVNSGGVGYTNGTCTRFLTGYPGVIVTGAASGGSITNVVSLDPFPDITNNLYGVFLGDGVSAGANGCSINILVKRSYLNFGISRGVTDLSSGLGLRYDPDTETVQYKGTSTSDWSLLTNKFGVSELFGVCSSSFTSPADGDLLIYNQTTDLWTATPMTGKGGISGDGTFSLVGVSAGDVNSLAGITDAEYGYLSGLTSNIQDQLNDKIQVDSSLDYGDMIIYSNTTGSGVSQFTKLNNPGNAYNFLKAVEVSPGFSIPQFANLYHGFTEVNTGISEGYRFGIMNGTTSIAESYSLSKTTDFLVGNPGSSFGIDSNSNGRLVLNYNSLPSKSVPDPTDLLTLGTSIGSLGVSRVQSISVENFVNGITGGGVSSSGGTLTLRIETGASPADITMTPENGQMAYFFGATTPGTSVLAVGYNNNWYGTCVFLVS